MRVKVVGALVVLALVFGVKFYSKWSLSREARGLMYQRYAGLAEPEEVKAAVDRHHGELFDASYRMGFKRTKTEFDAERYAREMDRRVEPELQRLGTAARLAARESRAAVPGQVAPIPVSTIPTPPAGHRVEITSMTVRAARPEDAVRTDFDSKQYVVDVLVADEADDIKAETPPTYEMGVICGAAGIVSQPDHRAKSVRSMGIGKALLSLPCIVPATSAKDGPCEVLLSVTDQAGNKAVQQRQPIP